MSYRIGIGQTDFKLGDLEYNLYRLHRLLAIASDASVDILVLPEMMNSGYYFDSIDQVRHSSEPIPAGAFSEALIDWSEAGGLVVAGVNEFTEEGLYNSAAIMADGKHFATYRKHHLWGPEKNWFLTGPRYPQVLEYDTITFSVIICFEWNFPERIDYVSSRGTKLILHPLMSSNYQWRKNMQEVARRNRIYIASANRVGKEKAHSFSGGSCISNPEGQAILQMDKEEIGVGYVDITQTNENE